MDHTASQSSKAPAQDPQGPEPQSPEPQNQGPQNQAPEDPATQSQEAQNQEPQDPQPQGQEIQATQSQMPAPPAPSQTTSGPVMRCCGKADIRDCRCSWPSGPCQAPSILLSHYDPYCVCYSCEWARETKDPKIRSRKPGQEGRIIDNPTFSKGPFDKLKKVVPKTMTQLELMHPILLDDRCQPRRWAWVMTPVQHGMLPFLPDKYQQYEDVWRVTLDSQGNWVGIGEQGERIDIEFEAHHLRNILYTDYGYHRAVSPYLTNHEGQYYPRQFPLRPEEVNPQGWRPYPPPNKSRANSAASHNTTLFIGGINDEFDEKRLRSLFEPFGEINYIYAPYQTNGFVQFVQRRDAQMAMRQMQGVPVLKCRLRISWGDPTIMFQHQVRLKKAGERLPYKGYKNDELPQHGSQDRLSWQYSPEQFYNNMPNPSYHQQGRHEMPHRAGGAFRAIGGPSREGPHYPNHNNNMQQPPYHQQGQSTQQGQYRQQGQYAMPHRPGGAFERQGPHYPNHNNNMQQSPQHHQRQHAMPRIPGGAFGRIGEGLGGPSREGPHYPNHNNNMQQPLPPQQRQYAMAQTPGGAFGRQNPHYSNQQQRWNFFMARPTPRPFAGPQPPLCHPSMAPQPPTCSPHSTRSGHSSRLNPSAASWTSSSAVNSPAKNSTAMIPNPGQQAPQDQAPPRAPVAEVASTTGAQSQVPAAPAGSPSGVVAQEPAPQHIVSEERKDLDQKRSTPSPESGHTHTPPSSQDGQHTTSKTSPETSHTHTPPSSQDGQYTASKTSPETRSDADSEPQAVSETDSKEAADDEQSPDLLQSSEPEAGSDDKVEDPRSTASE
ncbi:hypothetical protein J7T55_013623 [Diaporthe amygdali]|uniref:uncharacterized protein n=1 Tax=Phomopsis amygdali TaxID=1214568 RepID=UPI0022FE9D3E|nr:uncharacterized protein J7T55_013623 [Diaporthe amygdali]KAJ0119422.1 hypothetical protein J7T55_013623 [Diaporthe amygdali]